MNTNNTLVRLSKAGIYKDKKWLVRDVDLEINRGKIVTLIGPNGSGKTTTAKIALGLYKSISGNVERNTQNISYVPQKVSIDWTLPVRVIDFMVLTQNLKQDDISEALDLTGVKHLKRSNLRDLSGGEFQRVLLARAIAKKPDLLVLDEPVQGVDFTGEVALYSLIKEISEKLNCGILLISHDLHVVMSATDYVVCLNGHVCCCGTPKDVAQSKHYKELFGEKSAELLSIYEHNHDHVHSSDGNIIKEIK